MDLRIQNPVKNENKVPVSYLTYNTPYLTQPETPVTIILAWDGGY